jgi:NAD(P)-dependent dehydrogenase (short-subunit alcohol dehydrogenase family)
MTKKLEGKTAVVTGGSAGIGLAIAKRFVDEGAYVFITGRRQAELDKAKAALGKNVTTVQGDVANLADIERLYATVKAAKGSLDVIVANAGIVEIVPVAEATPEHFDRIFDVNVKGTYFTVQKALPLLKNGSSIVLVGSVASLIGPPNHSVYSATKAAVRSLVRTFAAELKDRQIRVNCLSPGPVNTPIFDGQPDGLKEMYAEHNPMKRIGKPEELAAAALFLASDESSFSSGIDLVADGGMTQF